MTLIHLSNDRNVTLFLRQVLNYLKSLANDLFPANYYFNGFTSCDVIYLPIFLVLVINGSLLIANYFLCALNHRTIIPVFINDIFYFIQLFLCLTQYNALTLK